MKTNDLAKIISVALGTAALTVIFWAGTLEAGNERDPLAATVAKPRLVAREIELTLATPHGQSFQAGEEPVFELQAANPGHQPKSVAVQMAMTTTSAADMLSRLPRQPAVLWQHQVTLVLKAGETQALTIATRTKLPTNTLASVTLQEAIPLQSLQSAISPEVRTLLRPATGRIVMLSFATGKPAPQLAAAR